MNTQPEQPPKSLKNTLLERIDSEDVRPRSRLFFQGRECVVWLFWLLSVLIGALAVAVSLFVLRYHQYSLYEATHNNFLIFLADVLPYLWITVFGVMVYLAIYNLRHTKHGYRYPVWVIMLSSVVLSLAGGATLQLLGFGYAIDDTLGRHMPMYMSQEKAERQLWQAPNDGRLLGRQVHATVASTTIVIFEDATGDRWRLDITELSLRDRDLLSSKQKVRLLGKLQNAQLHHFHACGAFPWMFKTDLALTDLSEERKAFVKMVYKHAETAKERLHILEKETFSSSSPALSSVCANMAVVHNMPMKDR